MPLQVEYSPLLILCSLAVAIMGSFTALRLTSNLRNLAAVQRKVHVAQAALAMGVGIWSMHFVGMLAVTLPITISYDPLSTLASALIAILVIGVALLSLHFGVRTKARIYIAGTLTGLGIVAMHYLGMSAISANCIVSYNPLGIVLAIGIAIASSIAAIELAYEKRSLMSIAAGSVVLGLAISAMHYTAMYFTVFSLGIELEPKSAPFVNTDQLALAVALSSFVLSGMFLLLAVPGDKAFHIGEPQTARRAMQPTSLDDPSAMADLRLGDEPLVATHAAAGPEVAGTANSINIPYERDKILRFVPAGAISIIKADGHYTLLFDGNEELFCSWSISRMEKSLDPSQFIRTHRSFIVNKSCISGFRRNGDKAFCVVGGAEEIEIPVSRTRIAQLREILQMS